MNFKKIKFCRSCKKKKLISLFTLGNFFFSGIFPNKIRSNVPQGLLKLILCKFCKLVQLDRNFNSQVMYGNNYGYRSGLNSTMIAHLKKKAEFLKKKIKLKKKKTIIDIGSNYRNLLSFF